MYTSSYYIKVTLVNKTKHTYKYPYAHIWKSIYLFQIFIYIYIQIYIQYLHVCKLSVYLSIYLYIFDDEYIYWYIYIYTSWFHASLVRKYDQKTAHLLAIQAQVVSHNLGPARFGLYPYPRSDGHYVGRSGFGNFSYLVQMMTPWSFKLSYPRKAIRYTQWWVNMAKWKMYVFFCRWL